MYRIEFKKSVKKDFKNIDKAKIKTILRVIESLKTGIDDKENVRKLKGNNPYYRLRTGNYRIIFEKFDDRLVILVVKVGHRKEIYNKLET